MSEPTIKNAVIETANITCGERGFLDAWLYLDYGGAGQGFGGYVLYMPKSFKNHAVDSPAGHFIYRVMEIAGVDSWDKLAGKTIRVRGTHSHIEEIGHIVKDDWFNPSKDFAQKKGGTK